MKKLVAIIIAFTFVVVPLAAYAQADQPQSDEKAPKAPPVAQELVAEGEFAMSLVTALKLGTPKTEAEAEDMLTSVGIAPKNGWIADYPMTPIIVGEVQSSLIAASATQKLNLGRDEALQAFKNATTELGMAITPAPEQYAQNEPPGASEYMEPSAINDYYTEEGPPAVTYYPPPWDYYYLYSWVPYPFWYTGFFFPGFFVLNDFDLVVFGHGFHRHGFHGHGFRGGFDHGGFRHRITNHFFDGRTRSVLRVDPTSRTFGHRFDASSARAQRFGSPEARRGAQSIFNRSFERSRMTTGLNAPAGRRFGGTANLNNRGFAGSTTGQRSFAMNRTPRSFGRSFTSPGRSFSSVNRPFAPTTRSFSSPMGGRSSFGGVQGGFRSGGFSGFRGGGMGGFRAGGFGGGFHGGGGFRR